MAVEHQWVAEKCDDVECGGDCPGTRYCSACLQDESDPYRQANQCPGTPPRHYRNVAGYPLCGMLEGFLLAEGMAMVSCRDCLGILQLPIQQRAAQIRGLKARRSSLQSSER